MCFVHVYKETYFMAIKGSRRIHLGTTGYLRVFDHSVDCWMNKASCNMVVWMKGKEATSWQTTRRRDWSCRPKISSNEQAGEITLDIRNGKQHTTVKLMGSLPRRWNNPDNRTYIQTSDLHNELQSIGLLNIELLAKIGTGTFSMF
jgi:hypothetical protein